MKFALAFLIITFCLIPFLIGAGFGLNALLDYQVSSHAHPKQTLKDLEVIPRKNRTIIPKPTPDNASKPRLPASVSWAVQTDIIQATKLPEANAVISPRATAITLLLMMIAANDTHRANLCRKYGIDPTDFKSRFDTSPVGYLVKNFIDTFALRLSVEPYYRIKLKLQCQISPKKTEIIKNLGIDLVRSASPVSTLVVSAVKFPSDITFNVELKQFSDSCIKNYESREFLSATSQHGKLTSLNEADFFELVLSGKHSTLSDVKLIVIRPADGDSGYIEYTRERFSQLDYRDFSTSLKDQVKLSIPILKLEKNYATHDVLSTLLTHGGIFDPEGSLYSNSSLLCDNVSDGLPFTVNFDQNIKFEMNSYDLSVCPADEPGDPEEVVIQNQFIMLWVYKEVILSFVIVRN